MYVVDHKHSQAHAGQFQVRPKIIVLERNTTRKDSKSIWFFTHSFV